MKKLNYLTYKAEWLALDINRSFRLNIVDVDIDWLRSLNIIMKDFNGDISDIITIK